MTAETPAEPDHLPRRFALTWMHRLTGFVAVLAMLTLLVTIGRSVDLAAAVVVGLVSGPALLYWAVRHYQVATRSGAVIYRDRLEMVAKTTSVVHFVDVLHVFLQMPTLAEPNANRVRLVLRNGREVTLDSQATSLAWFTHFARLLVSTIEESARSGFAPGGTLDFGEVKIRSGILYVGDRAMPSGTTCELVLRKNSIRFTKPDEKVVDLPLQWVSHPHLVEEWVNAMTGSVCIS